MKDASIGPVTLSIRSSTCHLRVVRAALEKMCELLGFDSATAGRIVLAVDEAVTNIIRHAYGGQGDQPIEISMEPLPGGLRVRLRDFGRPADPAAIRPRDLADVRPGGLGVHIIQECMDRVEYRPCPDGGTELTLEKRQAPVAQRKPG